MLNTQTWEPLTPRMTPEHGRAWNAKLSRDGTRVVFGRGEVWNAETGIRLVPAVVSHQGVAEIVLDEQGASYICVTDHSNSWDRRTEIRRFSIDGTSLSPPMINTRTGQSHNAIHPHSEIIAAAGHRLRFWDAQQGMTLSAAIETDLAGNEGRNQNSSRTTFFTPSGKKLYVEDRGGLTVVNWGEIVDNIPADEELEAWSGILSAHRIDDAGGTVPLGPDEYGRAWRTIESRRHQETKSDE